MLIWPKDLYMYTWAWVMLHMCNVHIHHSPYILCVQILQRGKDMINENIEGRCGGVTLSMLHLYATEMLSIKTLSFPWFNVYVHVSQVKHSHLGTQNVLQSVNWRHFSSIPVTTNVRCKIIHLPKYIPVHLQVRVHSCIQVHNMCI